MRVCFIGLVAILLVGCATEAKYRAVLETWIGLPIDRLVSAWGPPHRSFKKQDGRTLYTWSDQRTVMLSGGTTAQTTYHTGTVYGGNGGKSFSGTSTTYVPNPPTPLHLSCQTTFETDRSGKIIHWSYKGNDCRSR